MKRIFKILTPCILLLSFGVGASVVDAELWYKKRPRSTQYYFQIAKELILSGMHFSSVPFLKEHLISRNATKKKELDFYVDKLVNAVGVKQFEVLPARILMRSNAPMFKYILAKKYFRTGRYKDALKELNGTIPKGHPAKPFALMMEGSIFSILKKYKSAIAAYKQCISSSESLMGDASHKSQTKQLGINRDYCIVGIPRALFAAKKHNKAHLTYLDLPKRSYIWPEILFEEAWNSFYQRDYNRTLGKLVTYRAPVFDYYFNPEVDVLQALTYLELCLWGDVKKTVDKFYRRYHNESKSLTRMLAKNGRDYKYYYLMAKSSKEGKSWGNSLLNRIMKSITRDAAFIELFHSFMEGKKELTLVSQVRPGRFKTVLRKNLASSLVLQRNLIGAYVRKSLVIFRHQLDKAFEHMSYIKLEVLSRRKSELYSKKDKSRNRGDIRYLKRNSKQYFWDFVGEFWADELGDYVFSLKSECKK